MDPVKGFVGRVFSPVVSFFDSISQKVRGAGDSITDTETLQKENEELKDQRDEILKKLNSADGKEKEQLKTDLKNIVSKRFDLIVKRKELQHKKLLDKLEDLKKQIQASQDDVEKWKANKSEKVEARLKQLLQPSEEFHWD